MVTLTDVKLSVATELDRINAAGDTITDLEAEIGKAITDSVTEYNRKPWAPTQLADMTVTTVNGTESYATVDLTTALGDQDVTSRSAVAVNTITALHYVGLSATSPVTLEPISYRKLRSWQQGAATLGQPTDYAIYAGRFWLYPTPDAAYTILLHGTIKPVVPSAANDESVWFDQARELIEAAAGKRVAAKHLRDEARVSLFAALESAQVDAFESEHRKRTATGRLRSHA